MNNTLLGRCWAGASLAAAVLMLGGCTGLPWDSAPETLGSATAPPWLPVVQASSRPPPAARRATTGSVKLRAGHPQRYLVKPEDTVLTVATVFLEEPWRWREIWVPGAGYAEAIYPGQVIEVYQEKGQLRLRPAAESGELKLSPRVRVETISQPIPAIPRSAIAGFLEQSLVLSKVDWEAAPVVVGAWNDRVIMSRGDQIYVRNLQDFDQRRFRVFRPGQEYRDPITGEALGFSALYVADAQVLREGDPAVMTVANARLEVRDGDRLFPAEDGEIEALSFTPQAPPPDSDGWIISLLGENVVASQYQTVVVNLGATSGMAPGQILAIYRTGRFDAPLTDPPTSANSQRIGAALLYKVYERVSYGLITYTTDPIKVNDRVGSP
jgi:hypothetical protein